MDVGEKKLKMCKLNNSQANRQTNWIQKGAHILPYPKMTGNFSSCLIFVEPASWEHIMEKLDWWVKIHCDLYNLCLSVGGLSSSSQPNYESSRKISKTINSSNIEYKLTIDPALKRRQQATWLMKKWFVGNCFLPIFKKISFGCCLVVALAVF